MLKARLWTAAIALPTLLAAILWLPDAWFTGFIAVVGAWGLYEIAQMSDTSTSVLVVGLMFAGVAPLVTLLVLGDVAGWLLPTAIGLNMILLVGRVALGGAANGLKGGALLVTGALWVGGLFPYFALLRNLPGGIAGLIFMLLVAIVSDTAAYFGGRTMGRTKLIPSVSPNKTVEGAVSGLIGSVIAGLILRSLLTPQWSPETTAGIAAGIAILAQVGDLAGSAFKRCAGVKDSGWIFPGHGGLLDRTCSLVFATVFTYYCLK